MIAGFDTSDPSGYVLGVVPLLQKHGAEILAADFESQPLEGELRKVYGVVRFAEVACKSYNDPAYGPVKQIRLDSTQGEVHCDGKRIQGAGVAGKPGTGSGCMVMHQPA